MKVVRGVFEIDARRTIGCFQNLFGTIVSDDRSRSQIGIDDCVNSIYWDIYIVPVGLKICTAISGDAESVARCLLQYIVGLGDDSPVHERPLKRPDDNALIKKMSSLVLSLGASLPLSCSWEQKYHAASTEG